MSQKDVELKSLDMWISPGGGGGGNLNSSRQPFSLPFLRCALFIHKSNEGPLDRNSFRFDFKSRWALGEGHF